MVKCIQPKGGDALRLGSKGRYGLFAGKAVLPYLSDLENAIVFKGAFQMSRFTYSPFIRYNRFDYRVNGAYTYVTSLHSSEDTCIGYRSFRYSQSKQ